MILYHGTSGTSFVDIQQHGLKPRKDEAGSWFTNVKSNRNLVYLTNNHVISEFSGVRASIAKSSDTVVLLSVDTDTLEADCFTVDENFLDQEERGSFANCSIDLRKTQRARSVGDNRWDRSLDKVGMCGYKGIIPPDKINVVGFIPLKHSVYYRPEFDCLPPAANCYVFDEFLSKYNISPQSGWVYDNDTTNVVGSYSIEQILEVVERRHQKYHNIDEEE